MTSSAYFSKTWFNAAVPMPLSMFINSLVHHRFLISCFVSCFKFPRHKHPNKVRFYVKSDHPSQQFIQSRSRKQTGRQRLLKSGSLAGESTALRVRRQQHWAEGRVRLWDGHGQSLSHPSRSPRPAVPSQLSWVGTRGLSLHAPYLRGAGQGGVLLGMAL